MELFVSLLCCISWFRTPVTSLFLALLSVFRGTAASSFLGNREYVGGDFRGFGHLGMSSLCSLSCLTCWWEAVLLQDGVHHATGFLPLVLLSKAKPADPWHCVRDLILCFSLLLLFLSGSLYDPLFAPRFWKCHYDTCLQVTQWAVCRRCG